MRLVTLHPFDPWGSKIGGIENVVRNILRHAPEDIELEVIGVSEDPCARPPGRWLPLEYEGRPLRFFATMSDTRPNKRSWVPLFLRFPLSLRRFRFNDLDNATLMYHRVEPLAMGPKLGKERWLYVHSHPREWIGKESEVKWRYIPRVYKWVEQRAINRARKIFAVTKQTAHYLQESYPDKRESITFQPTGYQENIFYLRPPEERDKIRQRLAKFYSFDPDALWLVFAGRLVEQKNPMLAVETLALLNNTTPAYLLLAGMGDVDGALVGRADDLGILNRIIFLGGVNAEHLAEDFTAADLMLVTSRFEGMPISVLEGLACGLPVVSTPVGELPNLLIPDKTGVLAEAHTAEALCNAITRMQKYITPDTPGLCAQSVEQYQAKTIVNNLLKL